MNANLSYFNPTERFSDVADDYAKYRPGYPNEILEILNKNYDIGKNKIAADIGSGTGIFTKLLINADFTVYGIEPNEQMRAYSEAEFNHLINFKAIKGTAEITNLQSESIDVIFAAQAFHWFDADRAIEEFNRILKPNGYLVLIWNKRKSNYNDFMKKYEKIINKYCPDYDATNHKHLSYESIKDVFFGHEFDLYMINNYQNLDLESFKGRLKSCSYCLKPEHKHYKKLMSRISNLYNTYQNNGFVSFDYDIVMYVISIKKNN